MRLQFVGITSISANLFKTLCLFLHMYIYVFTHAYLFPMYFSPICFELVVLLIQLYTHTHTHTHTALKHAMS